MKTDSLRSNKFQCSVTTDVGTKPNQIKGLSLMGIKGKITQFNKSMTFGFIGLIVDNVGLVHVHENKQIYKREVDLMISGLNNQKKKVEVERKGHVSIGL